MSVPAKPHHFSRAKPRLFCPPLIALRFPITGKMRGGYGSVKNMIALVLTRRRCYNERNSDEGILPMRLTEEMIQKIRDVTESALRKIGETKLQKKTDLAVKFARSQPAVEILLDGKTVTAVAVDIATVFDLESHFYQIVDENGVVITVEPIQALSIVIVGDEVILCKSAYDAIGNDKFINAKYRTTCIEEITEKYTC